MGWQGPKSLCLFTKIPGRGPFDSGTNIYRKQQVYSLCSVTQEWKLGPILASPNPSIDMELSGSSIQERVGGGSRAPVSPETLPAQDSWWIRSTEDWRIRGRLGDASCPQMLGVRRQRLSPWETGFVSFWHKVGLQEGIISGS